MPSASLDARLARLYDWHPLRFDSGLDPKLLHLCAHATGFSRPDTSWVRRGALRPTYNYLRRVSLGEVTRESNVREWLELTVLARTLWAEYESEFRAHRTVSTEIALAALGARRDPSHRRPGFRNGPARRLVGLVVAQYEKSYGRGAVCERAAINARLSELFDDLFGDFETVPTAFQAEWRTPDVLGLASSVRQSRDFGLMPVLADALEEAGCDDADLLAHCRAGGPHFAGCWALDRVQYDWDEQYNAPAPPSAG